MFYTTDGYFLVCKGRGNEVVRIHYNPEVLYQVVQWILYGAYASVFAIGFSIIIFVAIPGGMYFENVWREPFLNQTDSEPTSIQIIGGKQYIVHREDQLKMISVGFEQNSAAASLVYGIGMAFIGMARLLAITIAIKQPILAIVYFAILFISIGAGIVTTRYDEIQELHLVAAAVWIASSLVYHLVVTVVNRRFTLVTDTSNWFIMGYFLVCVLAACVFLANIIKMELGDMTAENYSAAAFSEYVTVYAILAMDFVLIFKLHMYVIGLWEKHVKNRIEIVLDS
jgi:hypothetical protein